MPSSSLGIIALCYAFSRATGCASHTWGAYFAISVVLFFRDLGEKVYFRPEPSLFAPEKSLHLGSRVLLLFSLAFCTTGFFAKREGAKVGIPLSLAYHSSLPLRTNVAALLASDVRNEFYPVLLLFFDCGGILKTSIRSSSLALPRRRACVFEAV